jgi:hypothetical protein
MADDEPAPEFPYHIEVSPGVSALIHAEVPPDAFGPVRFRTVGPGNLTTDEDRAFFRWCEQYLSAPETGVRDSYDLFQQYLETLAGDEASL